MHEIFFLSGILLTSCYFTCTCLVLEISLFGSIAKIDLLIRAVDRNIVQVSVSEPPICIFITREPVTHMTSEAYVYIVGTVDSSPYKAMSRQLSVNVSILYVIKHL